MLALLIVFLSYGDTKTWLSFPLWSKSQLANFGLKIKSKSAEFRNIYGSSKVVLMSRGKMRPAGDQCADCGATGEYILLCFRLIKD